MLPLDIGFVQLLNVFAFCMSILSSKKSIVETDLLTISQCMLISDGGN